MAEIGPNIPWWARAGAQEQQNPIDWENMANAVAQMATRADTQPVPQQPWTPMGEAPNVPGGVMQDSFGSFNAQLSPEGIPQFSLQGNAPNEQLDLSQYAGMQDIGAQAPWGMDQGEWEGIRNPAGGTFSQMESTVQNAYQRPSASEEMRKHQEDALKRRGLYQSALELGPRGNPEGQARLQRGLDAATQDFNAATQMVAQEDARTQQGVANAQRGQEIGSREQYYQDMSEGNARRAEASAQYQEAQTAAKLQEIENTSFAQGRWPEGEKYAHLAGTPVPPKVQQNARMALKFKDVDAGQLTDVQKADVAMWMKVMEDDLRENGGAREEELTQKIYQIIYGEGAGGAGDAGDEIISGLSGVAEELRNLPPR